MMPNSHLPSPIFHPPQIHHAHPTRRLDDAAVRAAVARVLEGEGFAIRDLSVVLADHADRPALVLQGRFVR